MHMLGVCDWIPGLPVSTIQFLSNSSPPGCLQIISVGGILSKKGLKCFYHLKQRCLLGGQRRKHISACLTDRKKIISDKTQILENKHHGLLLSRGLRPQGNSRAQLMGKHMWFP